LFGPLNHVQLLQQCTARNTTFKRAAASCVLHRAVPLSNLTLQKRGVLSFRNAQTATCPSTKRLVLHQELKITILLTQSQQFNCTKMVLIPDGTSHLFLGQSMSIYTCVIAQCLYVLKNELWIIMVKKGDGIYRMCHPGRVFNQTRVQTPNTEYHPSVYFLFRSVLQQCQHKSEKKYPKEKSSFQEQEILCV